MGCCFGLVSRGRGFDSEQKDKDKLLNCNVLGRGLVWQKRKETRAETVFGENMDSNCMGKTIVPSPYLPHLGHKLALQSSAADKGTKTSLVSAGVLTISGAAVVLATYLAGKADGGIGVWGLSKVELFYFSCSFSHIS